MKAIVCHGPHDLRLDTWPDAPLGPQQLRVQVAFGGICGSDLHMTEDPAYGVNKGDVLGNHDFVLTARALERA